jgi:DNA-binding transcriptional LysR family regulator
VYIVDARERSFTRAAGKFGLSLSAVSHTVRALESRLGIRLLLRTTRNIAPTETGERLLLTVTPRIEEVEAEIAAVGDLGAKLSGSVRIVAENYIVDTVL